MNLLAHKYLLERLSPSNKLFPIVTENLRLIEAGIRGEERLLHQLTLLKDGIIIHNVSLELKPDRVQIDFLFITSSFCLVLESKNISGDLYF